MALEYLIFGTALGGSVLASYYDLKTTEVPNWVFYLMMAVGIPAVVLKSFLDSSFDVFAISGATGVGLLGVGYLMYRAGQWGGADMVLLALIGFMMPSVVSIFPAQTILPFGASFLINVFMVGVVYMMLYAAVFALRNKKLVGKFKSVMSSSMRLVAAITVSVAAILTGLMLYFNSVVPGAFTEWDMVRAVAIPTTLTVSFLFVYRFAKVVENDGFRKKIPTSQLRVGDMLMDERKLIGITEEQLRKIRKSGVKHVWIKDGVRFAPAFPLALVFTLYLGDAILLIQALA